MLFESCINLEENLAKCEVMVRVMVDVQGGGGGIYMPFEEVSSHDYAKLV